ncbi:MAG: Ig-like domain-containing protein [Candidatus Sedimenticola endophacoides]
MSDSGLEADVATGEFLANVALAAPGVGSWDYLVRDADQYCWIITVQGYGVDSGDMTNAVEATNPDWIDGCANFVAPLITSIARKTPASSPTGADNLVWTVTFDRAVENVDVGDFTVSGTTATVTGVAAVSGAEYDITVSGGDLADLNGAVTLGIAGGQDIANAVHSIPMIDTAPTTTNENTYVLDNVIPSMAIQNAPASHSTNAFSVTIKFSEDVTGFVVGDITVGGGAASNFAATDANTYTATITPTGMNDVTIDVAGDVAEDAAANGNTAATQVSVPYIPDGTNPRITSIGRQTPATSPTNADSLTWRVTFDEAVQNVGTADFTVSGTTATVSGVSAQSSSVYDVTVSGGDLADLSGTVTLAIAGGQDIEDLPGNPLTNTAPTTTNDNTYVVENARPTVAILNAPASHSTSAFPVTIEFSEDVTGFVVGDITVGGGAASNFAATDANTYTATITPTGMNDVTIDVAGDVAEDAAANGNTAATQVSVPYIPDGTNPRITSIGRQTPATSPTNADSLTWRVTFDEAVQNVGTADFTVSGTTATVSGVSAQSSSVYDVTVSGGDLADLSGTVTLAIAGGQDIEDLPGNPLTNTAPTTTNDNTYVVENARPTVSILNAPASHNTNAFSVTIEFSEDVTGFVVGDINVANGAASNFAATDANTYTATITPSGGSDITIDVAADVAQDSADNTNTAATQVSVVYNPDTTAPTVEILGAPASVSNADPFSVTFEFSEDVTGFTVGDITVGNGAASNFAASDANTYTADITPDQGGDITLDVAAAVAQDGASNDNTAATRVTVTCAAGCGETTTVTHTQQMIRNFTGRRIASITAQGPGLAGMLSGDVLGGGGLNGFFPDSPMSLNLRGDADHNQGGFSTSLHQFIVSEQRAYARKLAGSGANAAAQEARARPRPPANVWIKGRWTHAEEDRGGIDETSNFGIVYVGADYRYSKDLLIGLLGQVDWADEKSTGLGVEAEGRGWMLGPYLVSRLNDTLTLDLRAAWGRSDNKVNPLGTYWDNFDSERWQFEGHFTGNFEHGRWRITPELGLNYFEEEQQAYTDSNGFRIGAQTNALGSLIFGPTARYTLRETPDGTVIRPLIGLKGVWDFESPDITDVNGTAVGTEGLRAQLKLGVNLRTASGTLFEGSYTYDGIGISDFESHTAEFIIHWPLNIPVLPEGASLRSSYSLQSVSIRDALGLGGDSGGYKAGLNVTIPFY